MKTAIILGATGLTGGILLQKLIDDERYEKIILFSRKSTGTQHPKIEEHLIDMFQLKDHVTDFNADEVFCCIGTTSAKTPDKELYHKIDYGIPVHTGQLCVANKINTFIVVSALGADANSRIFYNHTKGEMENTILKMDIAKIHILQPSLIGGKRNERRLGESIFKVIMKIGNPFLIGPLKKYRMITPETIVSAMIWLANHKFDNRKIVSDKIHDLAKKETKVPKA